MFQVDLRNMLDSADDTFVEYVDLSKDLQDMMLNLGKIAMSTESNIEARRRVVENQKYLNNAIDETADLLIEWIEINR